MAIAKYHVLSSKKISRTSDKVLAFSGVQQNRIASLRFQLNVFVMITIAIVCVDDR